MRRIYTCFPGGRFKALTLSYDDGKIMDRRLVDLFNENGLKASFHLNSLYLGESEGHTYPYITAREAASLYQGHEIASHTCTHPTMTRTPWELNLREVIQDRENLESLCGYPVRGFSYPNGTFSPRLQELLRLCGISYGRITGDSLRFDLPDNFYAWKPTCHHGRHLPELTEKFLAARYSQRLMLFYVWGHSYEFERDGNWDLIETFARKIGRRDDIWYATGIQIHDYLRAAENLIFFADMRGVKNPGSQSVWMMADGAVYEVRGGETCFFDSSQGRPAYYLDMDRLILYKPADAEGLDPKLLAYRENRPPKTSGNPYRVLGEPVGDMRDNMDAPSKDLSIGVSCQKQLIGGVPALTYEPPAHSSDTPFNKRLCLLYIHGGSFIGGSAGSAHSICSYICQKSGALVISIDYRLAPETAFPENIGDCMKVLREIRQNPYFSFDRERLFLGGDSAGGNLALACAQTDFRENKKRLLAGLVLYYPVTDLSRSESLWRWHAGDYHGAAGGEEAHCAASLKDFEPLVQKLYLQGRVPDTDPLVSPILTKDFTQYPRMLVISAEYDYLRPQVEAFAKEAARQGCSVTAVRYGGMNHAFVNLTGIVDQAKEVLDDTVNFLLAP